MVKWNQAHVNYNKKSVIIPSSCKRSVKFPKNVNSCIILDKQFHSSPFSQNLKAFLKDLPFEQASSFILLLSQTFTSVPYYYYLNFTEVCHALRNLGFLNQ